MDELPPAQRVQLDALEEEYSRQYGAAVEIIKTEVGPGDEYSNEAARVVVSPNGAWCECIDLPMEFTGASGSPAECRFISTAEAVALLNRLYVLSTATDSANTRHFSLFVLYSRSGIADRRNVYVYHLAPRSDGEPKRPTIIGRFRQSQLPLFYRCRLDTDIVVEDVKFKRGVLFVLAHIGEKHLRVDLSYAGDDAYDFSKMPTYPVTH